MEQWGIADIIPRELLDNAVLLCSEDKPQRCHRREMNASPGPARIRTWPARCSTRPRICYIR